MNDENENEFSHEMYRLLPTCSFVAVAATFYTLLEWSPLTDPEGPIFGTLKGVVVYAFYFGICTIIVGVARKMFGWDVYDDI